MAFCLVVVTACVARPPLVPAPRVVGGTVTSTGGPLGVRQLDVKSCSASPDAAAVDLTDPNDPGDIVRIALPRFAQEAGRSMPQAPVGSLPGLIAGARRGVEVRLADRVANAEVVLDPSRCSVLNGFVRFYADVATGSARFDCSLATGARVAGDLSFTSCGELMTLPGGASVTAPGSIEGTLSARAPELSEWTFRPSLFEVDSDGMELWDGGNAGVAVSVDEISGDASILRSGAETRLRVMATASPAGKPLELETKDCRELRFERSYAKGGSGSRRYYGQLRVDCRTPAGGSVAGSIVFDERGN